VTGGVWIVEVKESIVVQKIGGKYLDVRRPGSEGQNDIKKMNAIWAAVVLMIYFTRFGLQPRLPVSSDRVTDFEDRLHPEGQTTSVSLCWIRK
jgi:hypothetical protein